MPEKNRQKVTASALLHGPGTVLFVVFLFAICLTGLGFAQPADDLSDIFEMPLEDLLNLKVTSPSKQAVRLTDAPAVISVWQQQTITALGLETLADLSDKIGRAHV